MRSTALGGGSEMLSSQDSFLELAAREAKELGHGYLGGEHLLLGLLRRENSCAARALRLCGIGFDGARREVDRLMSRGEMPGPHLSEDELLAQLGIDLADVRRRAEPYFGSDALAQARRRVLLRQSGRVDRVRCGGRPVLVKRALAFAQDEARALGTT